MDDKERQEDQEVTGRAKGGIARRDALSSSERKEIARNAARARWESEMPKATHEGELRVGESVLMAAVLPGGRRVLSQGGFLRAIGRARTPKAGTGVLSTVDGLPQFLAAEQLKPFISEELRLSTEPVFYRTMKGRKAVGYDASLLPGVCEVYLRLRDSALATSGKLPAQYAHIIEACDRLMRGFAHVGIVALVDEATGYQEVRDRLALQEILDQYLRRELAAWAKTFPDEFYKEIFRLRGWQWRGMSVNRPQVVARYTKNIVYSRLAPGLVRELEQRNPVIDGRRRVKHFQWLSDQVGHPALAQHLWAVMGLMRASRTWAHFMELLDASFPRYNETMLLPLMDPQEGAMDDGEVN